MKQLTNFFTNWLNGISWLSILINGLIYTVLIKIGAELAPKLQDALTSAAESVRPGPAWLGVWAGVLVAMMIFAFVLEAMPPLWSGKEADQ